MGDAIKKLYRSRTDRMIWGVCGGLGDYFNVDSTLFRALFVLLALLNGIGLLFYIFLAIIIPNESVKGKLNEEAGGKAEEISGKTEEKAGEFGHRNLLGVFIVIIGLIFLAGQFFPYYFRWLTQETIGAMIIVFIGVYLIIKK